jgi:hypothetical protein
MDQQWCARRFQIHFYLSLSDMCNKKAESHTGEILSALCAGCALGGSCDRSYSLTRIMCSLAQVNSKRAILLSKFMCISLFFTPLLQPRAKWSFTTHWFRERYSWTIKARDFLCAFYRAGVENSAARLSRVASKDFDLFADWYQITILITYSKTHAMQNKFYCVLEIA